MSAATPDQGEEADIAFAARAGVWLALALVAAVAAWAWFGRLDVVSVALGEVVPSSQIKDVQHLEGGVVDEILVVEGEQVAVGQPIVALRSIAPDADAEEMALRIQALTIDVARLEAEAEGREAVAFDAAGVDADSDAARQAQALFEARRARHLEHLAVQREVAAQREGEVAEITAKLANDRNQLQLLTKQIRISETLMQDQLTNEMLHLDLLKDRAGLQGAIAVGEAAIKRAEAALAAARRTVAATAAGYQQDVRETLDEKRRKLAETRQRLRKAADALGRTVLRAPVAGVVKRLGVTTEGGVVQPGATVAEIVPGEDALIVEARLAPQEIGFVEPGQTATLRLASSDAGRFGAIDGTVTFISPDTIDDPQGGGAFYRVRIATPETAFHRDGAVYRLVPGVQILCAIRTGERSVLAYLLDPFLASSALAMGER
jgi:adhesin transport system membrane fusion protein